MEWIEHVLSNPIRTRSKPMGVFAVGHSPQNLTSISRLSPNRTGKRYITLFQTVALGPEAQETRS